MRAKASSSSTISNTRSASIARLSFRYQGGQRQGDQHLRAPFGRIVRLHLSAQHARDVEDEEQAQAAARFPLAGLVGAAQPLQACAALKPGPRSCTHSLSVSSSQLTARRSGAPGGAASTALSSTLPIICLSAVSEMSGNVRDILALIREGRHAARAAPLFHQVVQEGMQRGVRRRPRRASRRPP